MLKLKLTFACLLVVVTSSVSADTLLLDQLDKPTVQSGDFAVNRLDAGMPAREVYEVLKLTTKEDFLAVGGDGAGEDHSLHGNLTLGRVLLWLDENQLPKNRIIISFDATPPPGESATTVAIKRLSLRLADRVCKLTDTIVFPAGTNQFGEVRLIVEPKIDWLSVYKWSPASFRISAEVAAPPGTMITAFISGEPEATLEETTTGAMNGGTSGTFVRVHSALGARARGGGHGGGSARPASAGLTLPGSVPFDGAGNPPARNRFDYTLLEPGLPNEDSEPARPTPDPIEDISPSIPDPIVPKPGYLIDDSEVVFPSNADTPVVVPPDSPSDPVPPTNPPGGGGGNGGGQPIPEPATGLLLLVGLALAGSRRQRRC